MTTTIVQPFTWIVRLDVAPIWVADGFTLSDADVHEMLHNAVPSATGDEIAARVLNMPPMERVLNMQGYRMRGRVGAAKAIREGAPLAIAKTGLRQLLSDALERVHKVTVSHSDVSDVELKIQAALAIVDGSVPISDNDWQDVPE